MMFDSYCKTVIKNCARRYWKREAKRSEHEYLVADDQLSIYPTDKDAFAEKYIITCGNVQAIFHCFALFTAVEQLKEKEKTVVVLKYWGGYTDKYRSADVMNTEAVINFTIRYREDIKPGMWVRFQGDKWNISTLGEYSFKRTYLGLKASIAKGVSG